MIRFKSANPNRLLIRGIVSMIVGITVIVVPDFSLKMMMQFLGTLLLLDGVIAFLTDYFTPKEKKVYQIVPRGISNLIVGIILIVFPTLLLNVFVFVIGLLLFMAGASQLLNQFGTKGKLSFSWLMLLISLVSLIGGIVLLTRPFESAQAILILFGAVIFVYGTGELVWSFKIRKLQQQQVVDSPRVVDAEYEEVEELHT
ncbi:MAG: hypothetical protein A2W90_19400 [Bacteroidetes bacterium GWF2_42_66]|nr:MAG: hypothetical protein A2W92_18080 [Bacteroidetes bacterium GWA2_42_15]OFX98670.1 MAG: hypothetical protein A2W89_10295 [Bacteroidetes bacterium GWE2_42_39]OFY43132.1 MAG: hypothetical protein A2W90_19400 [Bacteroidetes bacterium GWF2_42_66]HBL77018.1 hypothetical protein [Prolixibacteraceae bacterium]HCR90109.1 hypothetical protein [Prolixibacteraceae bacterium]